jgi:hypothetical protein
MLHESKIFTSFTTEHNSLLSASDDYMNIAMQQSDCSELVDCIPLYDVRF